jgi:hypothetical protein
VEGDCFFGGFEAGFKESLVYVGGDVEGFWGGVCGEVGKSVGDSIGCILICQLMDRKRGYLSLHFLEECLVGFPSSSL